MMEKGVEQIMIAALMFRSMEEIAEESIDNLQGMDINKGHVKIKLREVRSLLLRELNIDAKKYSGVDTKRLRELVEKEKGLMKLFEGKEWESNKDWHVSDIESLRLAREEKKKILETDNEIARSYYMIFGLVEKICKKIPTLDVDGVIELDSVLDAYWNGEVRFEGK